MASSPRPSVTRRMSARKSSARVGVEVGVLLDGLDEVAHVLEALVRDPDGAGGEGGVAARPRLVGLLEHEHAARRARARRAPRTGRRCPRRPRSRPSRSLCRVYPLRLSRARPRAARRAGCWARRRPCPAMSNAVPWSTLVRITGRPTVMLTPSSRPSTLIGPWPWSWYIATTRSKSPRTARKNAVSAGSGPCTSMPSRDRGRDGGLDLLRLLAAAEQAVLAGVRVDAADRDPRRCDAAPSASCPRRMMRSTSAGSIASIASISPMWVVTWMTRSFGVVSIIA